MCQLLSVLQQRDRKSLQGRVSTSYPLQPAFSHNDSPHSFQLVTGRTWRGTAFGGVKGRSELPGLVDGK